jgi:hypothetical protein
VPFGGGGIYNMNEIRKNSKYGSKLRATEHENVFWRPQKFEGKK